MWNKTIKDLVFQFLFRVHTPLLASFCNSPKNGGEINIPPSAVVLLYISWKSFVKKTIAHFVLTKLQTLKFTPFHLQPLWTPATHSNKWKKCLCGSSKICSFWSKTLNTSGTSQRCLQERYYTRADHHILDFGEYWETQLSDANRTSTLFIAAKLHLKR